MRAVSETWTDHCADPRQPHIWRLTMSLRFETDDIRYDWLNSVLGTWTRQFDESIGEAAHQALGPAASLITTEVKHAD